KAFGRGDALELADPAGQVEELAAVGADELDEDVELAGRDDHVVGLVPAGDLLGDRLRCSGSADPDHRLRVEAETERVRHPGDLEDVVVAQARVPRADRGLRDPDVRGDAPERLAPVLLQGLDDALVDVVEAARYGNRPTPRRLGLATQCAAIRPCRLALGQWGSVDL